MSWRSCRIAGYWPLLSRGLSGPRSTCQSAARSLLSSPHTPHHHHHHHLPSTKHFTLTRSLPLGLDGRFKRNYHLFHATSKQLLVRKRWPAGQVYIRDETPREFPPALRPAASLSSGFSHGVSTRPCEWTHNCTIPRFSLSSGPYVL
jgi:hypothetical protein